MSATVLCTAFASAAAAQTVTRSDWQMYISDQVHYDQSGVQSPFNGAPESFRFASIPPQFPEAGLRQWQPAPDPEIINYLSVAGDEVSRIVNDPYNCRRAYDYAYFQTVVSVPPGTAVGDFRIDFDGMDDGSRITIFNALYPQGTPDFPNGINNFVRYGEQASMDLAQFLTEGDNRVVITQVDDCPSGNKFRSAQVTLNGQVVDAEPVAAPEVALTGFQTISFGDVHIRTADGVAYDFQLPGDFVLFRNADNTVEVQARHSLLPENPSASVTTAFAVRVGNNWFEMYYEDRALFVNGEALDISAVYAGGRGLYPELPGGGQLYIQQSSFTMMVELIRYEDSHPDVYSPTQLSIRTHESLRGDPNRFVGFFTRAAADLAAGGLVGSEDGDPGNDLRTRSGEVIPQPASQAQIDRLGESWRVQPGESLFTMRPPAPPPASGPTIDMAGLPDGDRSVAATACLASGVHEVNLLRDCVYDVAVTGSPAFAEVAAAVQEIADSNPDTPQPIAATGADPVEDIGRANLEAAIELSGVAYEIPDPAPSPASPNGGFAPRVIQIAPAGQPKPAVAEGQAPAPEVAPVEVAISQMPVEDIERGARITAGGHYLIYQDDGNLCLYREVDDRFIWCINNDPTVRYADTVLVTMTPSGQLAGYDAAGQLLYALPTTPPNEPTTFTIGEDGVLRIVNAAGNVLWASNQN